MSITVYVHNCGQVFEGHNFRGRETLVGQEWWVESRRDSDASQMDTEGPFSNRATAQVTARELLSRHDRPDSRAKLVEGAPPASVVERPDRGDRGIGLFATAGRRAGTSVTAERARELLTEAEALAPATPSDVAAEAFTDPRRAVLEAFERARGGRA